MVGNRGNRGLCAGLQLQAQNLRLARTQGPYYGGSLPNVNQIGRNTPDFQVRLPAPPVGGACRCVSCLSVPQASFPSTLESSRSTRHHGLVERVQRDRRFLSPVRPYRSRQVSFRGPSGHAGVPQVQSCPTGPKLSPRSKVLDR